MRYEIGFGVGFDRAGKPIDPVQVREATKLVLVEASTKFGGCNILAGQGAWLDTGGNLVVEESRVLVVDGEDGDEDRARELAEFVRRVFNQQAVHFALVAVDAGNIVAPARLFETV